MLHRDLRGADLHAPSNELVENNTGSTITKFKVVALDGMGAVYPQVNLSDPNLRPAFGVAQQDIDTGKAGYITAIGFMFGLDTSTWSPGFKLYSDSMGNLTSTVPPVTNPQPVATVVRQSAQFGVIYVIASATNIANDSADWSITGNSGLDPVGNFIGTLDAVPFRIRTSNTQREIITPTGRFGFGTIDAPLEFWHKKAHSGYGSSGRIETTASVSTFATSAANLWTFTVPNNTVIVVEVSATAYNQVQSRSAALKRTAAFARIGGVLSQVGVTQSDYTFRSTPGMNLQFSVDQFANTVSAVVLSDSAIETAWVGHVSADLSQRNT